MLCGVSREFHHYTTFISIESSGFFYSRLYTIVHFILHLNVLFYSLTSQEKCDFLKMYHHANFYYSKFSKGIT